MARVRFTLGPKVSGGDAVDEALFVAVVQGNCVVGLGLRINEHRRNFHGDCTLAVLAESVTYARLGSGIGGVHGQLWNQ